MCPPLADQLKWLQAESAAAVSDLCKLQRGYAEVEHETYETRHKCAELEEKLKKKSGGTSTCARRRSVCLYVSRPLPGINFWKFDKIDWCTFKCTRRLQLALSSDR